MFPITSDLQSFVDQLKYDTSLPERGLVMIGHHGRGIFSFDPEADSGEKSVVLNASLIAADFAPPSFALLAMCSSAEVGYSTLVDGLSRAGVESMVLTSTKVSGAMAGHYVGCFFDAIAAHGELEVPVQDAHDAALRCLYEKHGYRDEILSFMLAGNPNLLLCRPD